MRYSIVFACLLSAVLLGYVVATEFGDPSANPVQTAAAPETAASPAEGSLDVPLVVFQGDLVRTKGPVNYFLSNCSRCHGTEDKAYQQIKTPRRGDALKQMIRMMAAGPAMAPIGPAEQQKQFDLHNAMLDGKPYAWLAPAEGDVMAGETITGTQIALVTKDKRYQANVSGYRFSLPNLEGQLILKRGDQEIRQPTGPR